MADPFDAADFAAFVAAQKDVKGFPSDLGAQKILYAGAMKEAGPPPKPEGGSGVSGAVNSVLQAGRNYNPVALLASGVRAAGRGVGALTGPGVLADTAKAVAEVPAGALDLANPLPKNVQGAGEVAGSVVGALASRGTRPALQLAARAGGALTGGYVGGKWQGDYDPVEGMISAAGHAIPLAVQAARRGINPSGWNQQTDVTNTAKYLTDATEGRVNVPPTVEGLSAATAGSGRGSVGGNTRQEVSRLYREVEAGAGDFMVDVPRLQPRIGGTPASPGRAEPMQLRDALAAVSNDLKYAWQKNEALATITDQLRAAGHDALADTLARARAINFKGLSAERTMQEPGVMGRRLDMGALQRGVAGQANESDIPPSMTAAATRLLNRGDPNWHSADKPIGAIPQGSMPRVGLGEAANRGYISLDRVVQMLLHPEALIPRHKGALAPINLGRTPVRSAIGSAISQGPALYAGTGAGQPYWDENQGLLGMPTP
jgi:hypothetical protein